MLNHLLIFVHIIEFQFWHKQISLTHNKTWRSHISFDDCIVSENLPDLLIDKIIFLLDGTCTTGSNFGYKSYIHSDDLIRITMMTILKKAAFLIYVKKGHDATNIKKIMKIFFITCKVNRSIIWLI